MKKVNYVSKHGMKTVIKITKTEIGVNLKNTSSPIFIAKYIPSLQSTS